MPKFIAKAKAYGSSVVIVSGVTKSDAIVAASVQSHTASRLTPRSVECLGV